MTTTPELRAVLWDMDGTILDSEKLWDVALHELVRDLGGTLTEQARHAVIGASGPDTLRSVFGFLGLEPAPAAMDRAARWLEVRMTELLAGPVPWRPGAKDAIGMVRATGLRTALVTNTERSLTEYGLDAIGRDYFDVSVCGDEVAVGKPAPDVYLRAAELLGVSPADCVAIEDSPTGAAAAQAAGCGLIVVPCEIAVPDLPGRVIRSTLAGLTAADLTAALAVKVLRPLR